MLGKMHYEVYSAENGEICLDMLRKDEFALVLLDLHMPKMDGYQTAECIRNGVAGQTNSYMRSLL